MGRPPIYTQELGLEICRRISLGESVVNICKDENMPASSSIYLWLLDVDKKEFSENYARARATQAEIMFEELLNIADDGENDYVERERPDGSTYVALDNEAIARSRLRVDTRKWYLSKVLPKKFGEKIDVTTDGKALPTPILPLVQSNHSDTEDNVS